MGNSLHCCDCSQSQPAQDVIRSLAKNSPASSFIEEHLKDLIANRSCSVEIDCTSTSSERILLKYKKISEEINLLSLIEDALSYFTSAALSEFSEGSVKVTKGEHDLTDKPNSQFEVKMKEKPYTKGYKTHEAYHTYDLPFHPLDYLLGTLHLDLVSRQKFDSTMDSHEVFYHYEEDGVIYYFHRCTTKKILMMKGKELVFATAVKKLPDGSYLEVNRSYSEPDRPVCGTWERMTLFQSATTFVPNPKVAGAWKAEHYQFLDPRVGVSLKVLKMFMGNFYKKLYKGVFKTIAVCNKNTETNWNSKMSDIDLDRLFQDYQQTSVNSSS